MWNFLRLGQSGVGAASTLDELIQELSRLEGSLTPNQIVAANSYLIWAEKAEQQLLAIFDSFSISQQLHTDRYWQIRALDSATSRPMPLIHAEIRAQMRHLEQLSTQLKHYISLLALPPDHWIVIPDTNVLIHGKLFHEVEWNREIGVRCVLLTVPLVILDELDRTKDRDLQYGRRARSVLLALDTTTKDKDWLSPIPLRQNVALQLLDEPFGHQRQESQDDEIVRQARYFAQINENRLILVTRDRGMRLRAQAYGLTSKNLPDHLERIKAATDD